ncbi:hypothetical protein FQN60_012591 [Etheostoma spectabile]|uniref:Uncharacterized protein n=1 Tax=Etheostoma spectabile TaxID=54343 RepID=A0A5J5D9B8_9PERO|nr:hypothetical protein FQN60_012591 [Etheostoma spectabile]
MEELWPIAMSCRCPTSRTVPIETCWGRITLTAPSFPLHPLHMSIDRILEDAWPRSRQAATKQAGGCLGPPPQAAKFPNRPTGSTLFLHCDCAVRAPISEDTWTDLLCWRKHCCSYCITPSVGFLFYVLSFNLSLIRN